MKKKNIIIAFAMLLLTGVALSTATYAWFTANRQISLGEIDVNVAASNGIQVSTDATSWKATLTTAELRNAVYPGSVTQFPDYSAGAQNHMAPVSTDGTLLSGASAGRFDMYLGELQTNGTINLTADPEGQGACSNGTSTTRGACTTAGGTWQEANSHFIAFDLFIQTVSQEPVEIGLLPSSIVSVVAEGTDAELKSSVRVGFIYNGVANNADDAYDLKTGTSYTIWEPNANTHTTTQIEAGAAVAGNIYTYLGATSACTGCNVAGNTTNFATVPANTTIGTYLRTNSTKTFWTIDDELNNTTIPEEGAGAHAWNTTDNANYPTLFTISQGINKVIVYIWFEGQDVDNENSATLGSAVGVTLNLNAKMTE